MIRPTILRRLDLDMPSAVGRPHHLASGSGLVVTDDFLYVVADDELHLGCFPRRGNAAGRLLRLFPGVLPLDHVRRKAAKPDLEALVRMPAFANYPDGALLAVPSGSTPHRCRGALLALNASGAIVADPEIIDFSGLYGAMSGTVSALDVEGGLVIDDALVLLHRGSRDYPLSALIELSLADVQTGLVGRRVLDNVSPRGVRWLDLGSVAGVALSITDAAALPDGRLVITAVAEQSMDSYEDGPCVAAAIAVLDRQGRILQLHRLEPTYKIEGIHAWLENGLIRMLLVTDADDASTASYLLEVRLPAAAAQADTNAQGQP